MTHHQVAVLTNRTQTQGKDGMATIKRIKATVITIGRKIPKDGTNLMEMVKKVTEETNLITIKTRMERKGRERSQVVEMEVIAALVTALMTAQAQMCQYVKNKKKKWAAYLGLWSLGFSRRRKWLYLGTTLCLGSKSTPRGNPRSRDHPREILKVQ